MYMNSNLMRNHIEISDFWLLISLYLYLMSLLFRRNICDRIEILFLPYMCFHIRQRPGSLDLSLQCCLHFSWCVCESLADSMCHTVPLLAGTAMQRFFCAAHTQTLEASTISTITKLHLTSATGAQMMLGRLKLTKLGGS